MLRQRALVLFAIGLAPACGRSAISVDQLQRDAHVPPDLTPAFGCAALQPLAAGVLTPRHAVRALFAPDRSSLVLQVRGELTAYGNWVDDLLLVRLPSGEVSPIIGSINSFEWLQPGSTLLVNSGIDLVVVNTDGSGARTLVRNVCDHVAAPDGSRVYALHDCDSQSTGTMDAIDVASGASTRLGVGASFGYPTPTRSTAVSPDGRWVAFVTFLPSLDPLAEGNIVVTVANADGRVETVTPQLYGNNPGFVSNDLLLYAAGSMIGAGDIRGHVPGTGDASYLIAANRYPSLFEYQVSPDKTWLLGAGESTGTSNQLYAIRLDGSGERLLASDLYGFGDSPFALRGFAFGSTGRVLYNTGPHLGVATVGLAGGTPTVLSTDGWFVEAPRLDQVALVEPFSDPLASPSRLRLVDLESGTDIFAYDSDGAIGTVGFPPNRRGLVFVESRFPALNRLRYSSADQSVVLGEWQATEFQPDWLADHNGTALDIYPVDPTGCFTVFDTDQTPGSGTRLAILPQ